jgi:hypothetical protein
LAVPDGLAALDEAEAEAEPPALDELEELHAATAKAAQVSSAAAAKRGRNGTFAR